jgi:hypothetical protein
VYPKGYVYQYAVIAFDTSTNQSFSYVEMLEQQQNQLVAGLQEMYRRLQAGESWPGAPLSDGPAGHPLTHDILSRLDLLHIKEEGAPHYEGFEEDCGRMQQRLVESGAPFIKRRGSFSSDSDHDHEHHQHSPRSTGTPISATTISTASVSAPAHQTVFTHPFARHSAPMTPPLSQSPVLQVPQLSTSMKGGVMARVSNVGSSTVQPSALRDPWIAPPTSSSMSFDDAVNTMDIDNYSNFNFNNLGGFDSTLGPMNMIGYNPQENPLLIQDFVNDNSLDLDSYLSQPVG